MTKEEWFLCPSKECSTAMDIKKVTYYEIVMYCKKCGARVILKRYIDGQFNSTFAMHTELSISQRKYLL